MVSTLGKRRERRSEGVRARSFPGAPMTQEDSQTETEKVVLTPFDFIAGTSESTRAKTAETFLELSGARVRNPIREARIGWHGAHFWHFVQPADSNSRV